MHTTGCATHSWWEASVGHMDLSPGLCVDLGSWEGGSRGREVQERGDVCIHMADSRCPTAGTKATF